MSDTPTGHTLKLIREEIEAPLRAEIERLRAILMNVALSMGADCEEFREHIKWPRP